MKFAFQFVFVASLLGHCPVSQAADRPNVVVMMVDDLGFSDLGCYGSEIDTPHLDELAANGLRFSQFYNTAKCHSSRVSLLSGQYCIAAGDTALSHAVTSAEVLGEQGYFTAMTGKWHLKQEPTDFGFQRYFGHLSGACNYFSGDNTFRLNGQAWKVPEQDFYTTVANVDYALEFLNEARQTKQPFYLYVAFNAPHAPLHALPEDYAKYKGRYESGWDKTRDARIAKQKSLGLFDQSMKPSPRPEHVPAWDSMSDWQRSYEANRMSTLAAMIDRVDQEVGKLVKDLKDNGELENTFILFVSDNGACPYDRRQPILDAEPVDSATAFGDSTGWSWARNSPYRYYKQNQFQGGISSPAIMHWPAGLKTKSGSITRQTAHLIDVLPTIADITKSEIPSEWTGRELRPISGVSLKPVLDGGELTDRGPIHFLFSQDRGLRDGDWKLVSFQGKAWELYDLAKDPTELEDLAGKHPDRLNSMVAKWNEMAEHVLHASKKSYSPVSDAKFPHVHREWTNFDATDPKDYTRRKRQPSDTPAAKERNGALRIRARKNTKMKIEGTELKLQFNGPDPGIAMDLRNRKLANGPYKLKFRLQGGSAGGGEMFYTLNSRQTLPNGQHQSFAVNADGQWQEVELSIPTEQRLHQIRVDVCEDSGTAVIADLSLLDANDQKLISWPESN